MDTAWTPELRLAEGPDGCRLSLVGVVTGRGATMQDAATDMLVRLFDMSLRLRTGRVRFSTELRPPEPRIMTFLFEIGEIAVRGGDIRPRVFGVPTPRPPEG